MLDTILFVLAVLAAGQLLWLAAGAVVAWRTVKRNPQPEEGRKWWVYLLLAASWPMFAYLLIADKEGM